MAQINRPDQYFNTKLYTGNGVISTDSQSITGVGFQPDWVWIKNRDTTNNHAIGDSVRGGNKTLFTSLTNAERTEDWYIQSFDSDGFTVGYSGDTNGNGNNLASWNWLAGGTASSNTDGSITSSVSANTTSGFSIVSYTGTGANATVGHGLGKEVDMIFFKNRSSAVNWSVYARPNGAGYGQFLNTTSAKDLDSSYFNNTDPTSSVFSVGTNSFTNGSGNNMIAYCFAEKKGFSKFGSYTGNGSTDGTFVYTGFRPAWILAKNSSATTNWQILDNKRDTFNTADNTLYPDGSFAEGNGGDIDFLSNGFKVRNSTTDWNTSGQTIIYMAFAENPLVGTNNIPATAR